MIVSYQDMMSNALVKARHYQRLNRILVRPKLGNVFWASECSANIVKAHNIINTIGKCGRAIYYSMNNELPEVIPYASLKRMKTGEFVEKNEVLTSAFISNEIYNNIRINVPIKDDVEFHGKIDEIMLLPNSDKYIVIEHKSAYGWGFTNVKKTCSYNEGYVMQLGMYMYGIRKHDYLSNIGIKSSDVDNGLLLYTDRGKGDNAPDMYVDIDETGGHNFITITTKCDGKTNLVTVESILEKSMGINKHYNDHTLPPMDYIPSKDNEILDELVDNKRIRPQDRTLINQNKKKTSWQCGYCSFSHKCIKGINANTTEDNQVTAKEEMKKLEIAYRDEFGLEVSEVVKRNEDFINKDLPKSYYDI